MHLLLAGLVGSSRMLKLELLVVFVRGVTQLYGMEYQPSLAMLDLVKH